MDLSKIRFAKDAMAETERLNQKVCEALEPRIKDVGLLGEVYSWFVKWSGRVMDASDRKKFLFIAMYLFCPSVLIGHTMPRGLRGRIKELIHVKSVTTISNEVSNLLFFYNHYKDFKTDVDKAYSYIAEGMSLSGLEEA